MIHEDVHDAGADTMSSGPPVVNVSGQVKMTGSTTRQSRGPRGRFKRRATTLIRGLDRDDSNRDRDNSVLFRDPLDQEEVHHIAPDYSRGVDPRRKSHEGSAEVENMVRHVMSCPACATGGACSATNGGRSG